jgi:hypothetical protein
MTLSLEFALHLVKRKFVKEQNCMEFRAAFFAKKLTCKDLVLIKQSVRRSKKAVTEIY